MEFAVTKKKSKSGQGNGMRTWGEGSVLCYDDLNFKV